MLLLLYRRRSGLPNAPVVMENDNIGSIEYSPLNIQNLNPLTITYDDEGEL